MTRISYQYLYTATTRSKFLYKNDHQWSFHFVLVRPAYSLSSSFSKRWNGTDCRFFPRSCCLENKYWESVYGSQTIFLLGYEYFRKGKKPNCLDVLYHIMRSIRKFKLIVETTLSNYNQHLCFFYASTFILNLLLHFEGIVIFFWI